MFVLAFILKGFPQSKSQKASGTCHFVMMDLNKKTYVCVRNRNSSVFMIWLSSDILGGEMGRGMSFEDQEGNPPIYFGENVNATNPPFIGLVIELLSYNVFLSL